jgi:hypothetical protein
MVREWIRRRGPAFPKEMKAYYFTRKAVAHG